LKFPKECHHQQHQGRQQPGHPTKKQQNPALFYLHGHGVRHHQRGDLVHQPAKGTV